MPGLKKYHADVRFNSNRVTPDEMDQYTQYIVTNPTVSASYVGTVTPGGTADNYTIDNTTLDYPRNLKVTVTGGTVGGTSVIYGKNQFGVTINESIAVATAAAGGSAAGTQIFHSVSSATWTPETANNATVQLGVATGTAAGQVFQFGLPTKIAGTGDIKALTWINGTAPTALNGGTIGGYIDTTDHAFTGTAVLTQAHQYVVLMKSSYNAENESNMANL